MLPVDPKREGSGGCRTGAKARSTWTKEPAREGGECQVKKEEEEEEGGTEDRRGKGPGETRAHVVYFSFGRRGSDSFAVVSDSVLNEARVEFLSHPKTMRPRAAPTVPRVSAFGPAVRLVVRRLLPRFVSSPGLPPLPSGPLPVFCIRYRIPTTSVPDQEGFSTFELSLQPLSCASAPAASAIKRTTDSIPSARAQGVFPSRK